MAGLRFERLNKNTMELLVKVEELLRVLNVLQPFGLMYDLSGFCD